MAWTSARPTTAKPKLNVVAGQHRVYPPCYIANFKNFADYYEDRVFMDWYGPGLDLDEGWKLHVPMQDNRLYGDQFSLLLDTLRRLNTPHKYVKNRKTFFKELENTPTQVGKFITVYPRNGQNLRDLVAIIECHLRPHEYARRPNVPGEKQVGVQKIVTTRYGSLTSLYILTKEATKLGAESGTNPSHYVKDDRTKYKPAWIEDPFDGLLQARQFGFKHDRRAVPRH